MSRRSVISRFGFWILGFGFILGFLCIRPRCPRPSAADIVSSLIGPIGPISPIPSSSPVHLVTTLFGSASDQLRITIPPNPDTVRLAVGPDLVPCPIGPMSPIGPIPFSAVRRSALIRFRPTFHLSVLLNPSSFQPFSTSSWALGLKLRPLEVWRFGLAGYLTTKGPGVGLDYQLIGNLSADAACLWRIDHWFPWPAPFARTLYVGLSLRL